MDHYQTCVVDAFTRLRSRSHLKPEHTQPQSRAAARGMGALAPQPRLMAVGAHVASAGAKLRLGHEIRLTSVRPVGYLLSLAFTRLKRASPCMRARQACRPGTHAAGPLRARDARFKERSPRASKRPSPRRFYSPNDSGHRDCRYKAVAHTHSNDCLSEPCTVPGRGPPSLLRGRELSRSIVQKYNSMRWITRLVRR